MVSRDGKETQMAATETELKKFGAATKNE